MPVQGPPGRLIVFRPNEPGGRARLFFYFFYKFNLLIELVEFNFVLTFLKDARERGAHDLCWIRDIREGT